MIDYPAADPVEEKREETRGSEYITYAVDFTGTFSGKLIIFAPETLARVIAANMLGIDEDDDDSKVECKNALGGILNVIPGNYLPAIAGTKVELKIAAPVEISRKEKDKMEGALAPALLVSAKMYIEDCETELLFPPGAEVEIGAVND